MSGGTAGDGMRADPAWRPFPLQRMTEKPPDQVGVLWPRFAESIFYCAELPVYIGYFSAFAVKSVEGPEVSRAKIGPQCC